MGCNLEITNVDAGYGSVKVLHDVSIAIHDGETVVLLGANGNGKSTLIKCISGIVMPSRGHVILDIDGQQHNLVGLKPEQIVDLGIALVPEGRRLFASSTVEENLMMGAYRRQARKNIDANIAFVFDTFPVLKQRRNQIAGSMSGGEQQMVAIGRAMMSEPRLLVIDEPSVGLAPVLVSRMIDSIQHLKKQRNLTVLMAEQNFRQAVRIADRGYIIVHGEIEFEGKNPTELAENDVIKKFYLGL